MFPDDTELDNITPDLFIELDRRGFFPAPGESAEAFLDNVRRLRDSYGVIADSLADGQNLDSVVGFHIGEGMPIPAEVLAEAEEETRRLFDFDIDWVPAYFLSKGLGAIWGGCTVITDSDLALFFIRKDFREKKKWFIYDRQELLAHELSHVARSRFNDPEFEEHFAYMTAKSSLRKFMGNCFRTEWDALIFILPVFLLLGVQILNFMQIIHLPEWIFWIVALCGPGFLIARNMLTRWTYTKAEENLRMAGAKNPRAVLFRCTQEEIRETAKSDPAEIAGQFYKKAETELRFRIITTRFFE